MATESTALLQILAHASLVPDSAVDPGAEGELVLNIDNGSTGERWSTGTGSGEIDRILMRTRAITASATQSYNLLAAGSLTDALGQAIDADELKGLVVECVTGAIAIEAPAAAFLPIFADASGSILLSAGHYFAMSFGAAGLDVTAGASFDITDTSGTSSYKLWAVIAQ